MANKKEEKIKKEEKDVNTKKSEGAKSTVVKKTAVKETKKNTNTKKTNNANKEQPKQVRSSKKVSETIKKENESEQKKGIVEKNISIEEVERVIDSKLKETKQVKVSKSDGNVKKEKINFSLFEVILLIIITILSCILVGYFINPSIPEEPSADKDDIANETVTKDEIELFLEQYNYILNNYYGDIDKEQLMKDAIEGMFSSLDDYSQVIDQESNSFTVTLEGEYEGVGIAISNDVYGNIVIQEVYEDTPAYKAGFLPGDMIVKFNDESLTNVTTMELVEKIANSDEMELTVLRGEEFIIKKIKREKIILKSVKSKMLDNEIGYIDVDIFANNTLGQFKTALEDLEKQKMKSLIIDLRDNTGGHLSAVEEMLYLFLDKNHVIYQTEDKTGVEKFYSKGNKDKKYKIVILQNGASASASEIMASALKEELGAYIIGTTSFGKGTVQTLKNIDADFQYKFTIKRWLTPKGNWVNGVGIKPNLEVILSEEYYSNPIVDNDNQLKAAIDYLSK